MVNDSIDGKELEPNYGVTLLSGINNLLDWPELKEPYSYDWQDENGIEVDLSTPVFKAKRIVLGCLLIADSPQQFVAKQKAFFTDVTKPGLRTFYSFDLEQTYYLYYSKVSNYKALTTMRGTTTCATFDLELVEPDPFKNDPAFLFDVTEGMDLLATTAINSPYNFSLDDRGHLIIIT